MLAWEVGGGQYSRKTEAAESSRKHDEKRKYRQRPAMVVLGRWIKRNFITAPLY